MPTLSEIFARFLPMGEKKFDTELMYKLPAFMAVSYVLPANAK
jgi:hypothetical protein